MFQEEQLDVAGLTNLLRGASDAQVLSITASVCSVRQGLQDKILELLVQPPQPRNVGMIKAFFPDKQYGFIDSPETFALYQRDVFLSGQQIGPFQPGQKVSFVVTQGKNGQPQAQDLMEDPPASRGMQGRNMQGGNQMMNQMGGGMQGGGPPGGFKKSKLCNFFSATGDCKNGMSCTFAHGEQELGTPQGPGPNNGRLAFGQSMGGGMQGQGGFQAAAMNKRDFNQMGGAHPNDGIIPPVKKGRCDPNAPRAIGIIKNFHLDRKFGFITSPDTTEQFGRDAFLSSMQIGTFRVGQTVSFAISANAQGHPQAQDLQDAENGQGIGVNSVDDGSPHPMAMGGDMGGMGGMGGMAMGNPRETMQCSVHGRKRTVNNLGDDGNGGMRCMPGLECQGGGMGPIGQAGQQPGMGQQQQGQPHQGMVNPSGGLDVSQGWTPELEQRMLDMANAGNDVDLDNLINMMGGLQDAGGAGGAGGGDRPVGMINKFDANKKFGFIDCPQLKSQFGYDAFLSSMQIGEFQNGMTVSFDYQLKNGRPQASNLMPA